MKPCSNNRKLISWLALGALDDRQARGLRAHLETCDGCRRYLDEISNVTAKLGRVEAISDIRASESFHQKVIGRLRTAESVSAWQTVLAYLRAALSWRVGLPLIGATVAAIALLLFAILRPPVSPPSEFFVQPVSKSSVGNDFQPTIGYYQMVANRSLDEFDQLLTREASKTRSHTAIYTASTFDPASLSD